jgi:hypothetical protein
VAVVSEIKRLFQGEKETSERTFDSWLKYYVKTRVQIFDTKVLEAIDELKKFAENEKVTLDQ